jgi:hypothetical protein
MMSTIVAELCDALRAAGVPDDKAMAAAAAVFGTETREALATKADLNELRIELRAAMAQLEATLIRWNVGTIIAMTAVFAAIVKPL